MLSLAKADVAIVTARANSGSDAMILTEANVRFAAPRSRASLVTPGLSSRDLIDTGTGSAGAFASARINETPVKGTAGLRESSIVRRKKSEGVSGNSTRKFSAPLFIRKIG